MSSCHDEDIDRLWCIGLCQGFITKTSYFALKVS